MNLKKRLCVGVMKKEIRNKENYFFYNILFDAEKETGNLKNSLAIKR